MRKINTTAIEEQSWRSPAGKFAGAGKQILEALGRKPRSTDLRERHPFDVEILRLSSRRAGSNYVIASADEPP